MRGTCNTYFANKKELPFLWWAQNFKWLLNRSSLNILVNLREFFMVALPFVSVASLAETEISEDHRPFDILYQTTQWTRTHGAASAPAEECWVPLLCVLIISRHFSSSGFSRFFTHEEGDSDSNQGSSADWGTANRLAGALTWTFSFAVFLFLPTALCGQCSSLRNVSAPTLFRAWVCGEDSFPDLAVVQFSCKMGIVSTTCSKQECLLYSNRYAKRKF